MSANGEITNYTTKNTMGDKHHDTSDPSYPVSSLNLNQSDSHASEFEPSENPISVVSKNSSENTSYEKKVDLAYIRQLETALADMKSREANHLEQIRNLKIALRKRDISLRNLTEEYDSKRSSFNIIMNAKKEEIELMKQERYHINHAKLVELEKEISNLKMLYNEKEVEVLNYKEREYELVVKHKKEVEDLEKKSILVREKADEQLSKLKDQLFFSLALSFKLDSSKKTDLNLLYEQCKAEMVPVEMWTTWISQFVNENRREEGEEENVEHF